ncbi:HAD-like domain-containing protein [Hyaloraphidium curvatum]|nr:HAD-like domain-containing protein [Hyaloraphidium curvatum]
MAGGPRELRPAVFVDRDGTLNPDAGHTHRAEDFRLFPGAADALRRLAGRGFLLAVVTNQGGIGRGLYTEGHFEAVTDHMHSLLAAEGARVDAVVHCPHAPDARCRCRKPEPGMFVAAATSLSIDLAASFAVGDRPSDLIAARTAGIPRCALVHCGEPLPFAADRHADFAGDDLSAAARWILSFPPPSPRLPAHPSRALARAPLRVGLAGGGTDVPPFPSLHGGAALALAISLSARAEVCLLPPGSPCRFLTPDLGQSLSHDPSELALPPSDSPCLLPLAAYRHFALLRGPFSCLASIRSDAPPGSGLGGSSACLVALVRGFAAVLGIPMSAREVAEACCTIERGDLAMPGGGQDAFSAASGGVNLFTFPKGEGEIGIRRIIPGQRTVEGLEGLVLRCSGAGRPPGTGHAARADRDALDHGEEEALLRMKGAALAAADALERDDWPAAAAAIAASWSAKPSGGSVPAVVAALGAGAAAAKVCGAGGGGFAVALCGAEAREAVERALAEASSAGWTVPVRLAFAGATAEIAPPDGP